MLDTGRMLSVLVFKSPEPWSCFTVILTVFCFDPVIKKKKKTKQSPSDLICMYFELPRLYKLLISVSSSAPLEGRQLWAQSLKWAVIDFQWAEWRALEPLRQRASGSTMLLCWQWLKPVETLFNKAAVKQAWTLLGHFTAAPPPPPPKFRDLSHGHTVCITTAPAEWHNDFAFAPRMNHLCRC